MGSLQTQITSNDSDISMLQSDVSALQTSATNLQIEIDNVETSTGSLQSDIDSLKTSTGSLQSQIISNDNDISSLQNQIASNDIDISNVQSDVSALKTSTGSLQVEIDNLEINTGELQNMVTMLKTSTGSLQAQINNNDSDISALQNQLNSSDANINNLQSNMSTLQTNAESMQSQINEVYAAEGYQYVIPIVHELKFDTSMLPKEGEMVMFKFNPSFGSMAFMPRLIFDPSYFGKNGRVKLPRNTRFIISGEGIVELKDGVIFDFGGSVSDEAESDWPQLIVEDGAIMHIEPHATVVLGGGTLNKTRSRVKGAGIFAVRNNASVLLDSPSHMIVGEHINNKLKFAVERGGMVIVNNVQALLSFQLGTFDILFNNHSAFTIAQGIVEFNMLNGILPEFQGVLHAGVIKKLHFTDGSKLEISKSIHGAGLLRMAPNAGEHDGELIDFDNQSGFICGEGNMQLRRFDVSGKKIINTTVHIQKNMFATHQDMLHLFMMLGSLFDHNSAIFDEMATLVSLGSIPNADQDGRLAVFCPTKDGSIVKLAQGDHDVFYDRSKTDGDFDLIRGFDARGQLFTIKDCDESTRTPPAP